ncbi:hypothetical protein PC129_g3200 [Phytophthora cactorum]|nr:hypothetical protein PC111_g3845 [Phytophthora cactorum]KAG2921785.1 hypothetical protein PC114_g5556 [Phytophthora cactorum]KAG2937257.1 hypothetical protein PC115_g4322 [Phytophthora cactorum]KAG2952400.1 hypothetical protein PC117_g2847 [Phytophthora cactorum]KAG2992593.1 hypothetical protein PC118_g4468 [Phytophthora cactorum]
MTDVTPDNVGATVVPVFAFGLLQITTFVLLALVIKKNCRMNMLYQLGFVLETQMPLIQGKLIFWFSSHYAFAWCILVSTLRFNLVNMDTLDKRDHRSFLCY